MNTEGIENYPDLPQRSEVEIVVIEETESSPTKSLVVLQVTGGEKTISEERGNVNKESSAVGSQECLLSSSDEGSEGLEKFLRDKLESLGGDGIENNAEVDPAEVLELLDSNLVDRDNTGSGVVTAVNKFPRSQVDEILRAELGGNKIGVGSKRSLCDVEFGVADERPSKVWHLKLLTRVGNRFVIDLLWLVCQMLSSRSRVVPDRMTRSMVHRSWSQLHEVELVV